MKKYQIKFEDGRLATVAEEVLDWLYARRPCGLKYALVGVDGTTVVTGGPR